MIAQWMMGALLFSGLAALAALAAERGLRVLRAPTRVVWVLAVVVAAAWPVIAPVMLRAGPEAAATTETATAGALQMVSSAPATWSERVLTVLMAWGERADVYLISAWAFVSALLLAQVLGALATLRRVRRSARPANLGQQPVLIDATMGPAVIGIVNPVIVIPAWLLHWDDALRALAVQHEREHCRARDPVLVWLGVIVTTALPWNLALWWMSRRLRLAMEIDCDARTLRHTDDRGRYAQLLLLIAQQNTSARFAPALSGSSSHLKRRILAMQQSPQKFRALRVAIAASAAAVMVAAACSSRIASNLMSPVPVAEAVEAAPPSGSPARQAQPYFDFQVEVPAALTAESQGPRYPRALRDAGFRGSVLAQFEVRADGTVDTATFKVLRTTDAAFSEAVHAALPALRFSPARVGGQAVRQLAQVPFAFELNPSGPAGVTPPAAARAIEAPVTPSRKPAGDRTAPSDADIAANRETASHKPYFDFQVSQAARPRSGTAGPLYPASLRSAGVQGQVLAQFVVNAAGQVDMATFKVLKSDHEQFSEAVRAGLAGMSFTPAMLNGSPVAQLVQSPFQFSLGKQ